MDDLAYFVIYTTMCKGMIWAKVSSEFLCCNSLAKLDEFFFV